jgi:hypothetical protein
MRSATIPNSSSLVGSPESLRGSGIRKAVAIPFVLSRTQASAGSTVPLPHGPSMAVIPPMS